MDILPADIDGLSDLLTGHAEARYHHRAGRDRSRYRRCDVGEDRARDEGSKRTVVPVTPTAVATSSRCGAAGSRGRAPRRAGTRATGRAATDATHRACSTTGACSTAGRADATTGTRAAGSRTASPCAA